MAGRALIPAGYMPGGGGGPLFELCHDAVPAEFLAWLEAGKADQGGGHGAHSPHAHHGAGHTDPAGDNHEPCSVGHMLSVVFIDDACTVPELVTARPVAAVPTAVLQWHASPRYLPETRAPPGLHRAS